MQKITYLILFAMMFWVGIIAYLAIPQTQKRTYSSFGIGSGSGDPFNNQTSIQALAEGDIKLTVGIESDSGSEDEH